MSEEKPYQAEVDSKYVTGQPKYVEAPRLRTGQIVEVRKVSGTFQNAGTSEYIELGYWNGHAYIPVAKGQPDVAGDFVSWDLTIKLREEQWLYAYCADVADGEVMKLRANGVWIKW